MAAETVSVYPISFHQDSISVFGIENHHLRGVSEEEEQNCRNNSQNDTQEKFNLKSTYYKERDIMGITKEEIALAREKEHLNSSKLKENHEMNQLGELKERSMKQLTCSDAALQGRSIMDVKKKRNVRKRNRCDMSPEELRRLRERERKAQQSRRDRIRAQKRQAQGWHDDDAAWEAFLDQTENIENSKPVKTSLKKQSSLPSMVCSMSPHNGNADTDRFSDAATPKSMPIKMEEDIKSMPIKMEEDMNELVDNNDQMKQLQKQDSNLSNDTDSNCGSNQESMLYSSDENSLDVSNRDHINNGKRMSRRHFLPSDELEKLRKRERDAKRKQRERTRLLAHTDNDLPAEVSEETDASPNSSFGTRDCQEDVLDNKNNQQPSPASLKDQRNGSHFPKAHSPRDDLSPKFNHKVSPHRSHGHHHTPSGHHMHYPVMFMPEHHHYSSHYFRERHSSDLYFPRHLPEERHSHKERDDYLSPHEFHRRYHHSPRTFHSIHQPHSMTHAPTSPEQGNSPDNTSPPSSAEKKRMISRNVDRKKLSEEELEELRRRERDYQRERRARIRLEKAKSQANHDQFHHGAQDEGLSQYYHSPIYHPHTVHRNHDELPHIHRVEKLPHHIFPRYESIDYDIRKLSPNFMQNKLDDDFDRDRLTFLQKESTALAVSIPCDKSFGKLEIKKDSELLQVVPKTRECEDMKSKNFSSDVEKSISPLPESNSKKNVLENICLSLKKESPDWNGEIVDEDGDKLVIVQPNTDMPRDTNTAINNGVKKTESIQPIKEGLSNGHFMTKPSNSECPRFVEEKSMREKLTGEQLERRRRSNREAQRRRRARLKMQNSSEDCSDLLNSSNDGCDLKEKLNVPNGVHEDIISESHFKGCRIKVTPSRPDSLYPEDFPSHHIYHKGNHDDHFIHEKYRRFNSEHYPFHGKHHFSHPSPRSLKDMDELHHSRFYHDVPAYASEKYIHDYPLHHHRHSHDEFKHSPRMYTERRYDDHHRMIDTSRSSKPNSMPQSPTPQTRTEFETEPSKQSGRKRKQCVPRKVVSSNSNTPEEDIDVCNISRSPDNQEGGVFTAIEEKVKDNALDGSAEQSTDPSNGILD